MKKLLSVWIIGILIISLLAGCGQKSKNDGVVNISILNSKPEIKAELVDGIQDFWIQQK